MTADSRYVNKAASSGSVVVLSDRRPPRRQPLQISAIECALEYLSAPGQLTYSAPDLDLHAACQTEPKQDRSNTFIG